MSSLPSLPIPPSVGVLVEKGQGILRGHSEAPRTMGDFGKIQILSKFPFPSWGVRLSFHPGICTVLEILPICTLQGQLLRVPQGHGFHMLFTKSSSWTMTLYTCP